MRVISHCPLSAVEDSSESNSQMEKSSQLLYHDLIQTEEQAPPCLYGVGFVEQRDVISSVRDAQLYPCTPSAVDLI